MGEEIRGIFVRSLSSLHLLTLSTGSPSEIPTIEEGVGRARFLHGRSLISRLYGLLYSLHSPSHLTRISLFISVLFGSLR